MTDQTRSDTRGVATLVAVAVAAIAALAVQREFLGEERAAFILPLWGVVAALGLGVWARTSRVLGAEPEPAAPAAAPRTPLRTLSFRALQVGGWLALAIGLALLRHDLLSRAGTWMWCGGLFAIVAGFALRDVDALLPRWIADRRAVRAGDALWAVLALAMIAAAFALRLQQLETIPPTFLDDEGSVADYGLNALHDTPLWGQHVAARVTLFRNGAWAYPLLGSYVYAAAMQVTGETTFGLRAIAAVVGGVSVVVLYLMLLPYVRRWAAVGAALLLAVSHVDLYWTRSGMSQSLSTTAAVVIVWLVLRGVRSRRLFDFALAGLVLGLAQYFYEGARLLVVVLGVFFAYLAIADRRFLRERWTHVAVMVAISAAVFAPIGLWYLQNPDELLARSGSVFIFAHPDYLASRYPGMSTAEIVVEQLRMGLEGLAYRGDGSGAFYSMRVPLVDPVTGALLLLGIGGFCASVRRPERVLVGLWLWIPALIACAITVDPPPMTRLIMILPSFFFVIGVVVDRIGRLLERVAGRGGLAVGLVLWLGALGYAAAWNHRTFFVDYPRLLPANLATVAGNVTRSFGPSHKTWILSPPYLYFYGPSMRFLTRGLAGEDLRAEDLPVRERGRRHGVFLVMAPLADALARLRAVYPGGRETEHRDGNGQVLMTSYEVAAADLNAAAGEDAPWLEVDARFGRQGSGAGEFREAAALAVDAEGRVYVADTGNARVVVFDPAGEPLAAFGAPGGGFRYVSGIALAPDGSVVAVDRDARAIQRFDRSGRALGRIDGSALFEQPVAIAVAGDGDLLVVDRGRAEVLRLSPEGAVRFRAGRKGTGAGEFTQPAAVAVAADGKVYVADRPGGRVQRFSPELAYEAEWPIAPTGEPQNVALAVSPGDPETVYVVDSDAGRVQRYTADGRPLAAIGDKGDRMPRQLMLPRAVGVDARGSVYVLDGNRHQIYRFDVGREGEIAAAPRH